MDSGTLSRKTLGRGASLCDLYNVRQDTFCGVSLLNSLPPEAAITSLDVPDIYSEYTNEHTYHDKFHKLSVEAGLKISVLGGLFSLSGSGKYLNDEASSHNVVRGTLIYRITTKEDSIDLLHNQLRPHVIPEQLLSAEATHVVSKIRWGANVFVTFEKKVRSHSEAKEIGGMLKATLTRISKQLVELSGKGEVRYSDTDKHEEEEGLSIKVQGDVVPDDHSAPQSVEQVLSFISMIPQCVKKFNQGKGKPLQIELYPIKLLAGHFGMAIQEDKLKDDIDEATIGVVESKIDNSVLQKQILNDFVADVRDFCEHVSADDLFECLEYQKDVNIADAKFRGALKQAILAIRQEGGATSVLDDVIREYNVNPHSAHNIRTFLDKKSAVKAKMDLFQVMKEKNVEFLPKAESIDNFVAQYDKYDVYVLYYSDKLRNTEKKKWQIASLVFLDMIKERNEALKTTDAGVSAISTTDSQSIKFLVVDVDLHSPVGSDVHTSTCIVQYSNGRLVTGDVVRDTASAVTPNVISWERIDTVIGPPTNVATAILICPLAIQSKCNAKRRQWVCHRCNQSMKYAFGDHFYCNCGGVLLKDCRFKCCDPQHGSQFGFFESLEKLKEQLPKSGPGILNILLLGQTGVGKTTWINALRNYLEYKTLQDAMTGGVKVLIPSQFKQGKDTTVMVGEADSQEASTGPNFAGKSSTQSCRSHFFELSGHKIQIIDTPGIGDVRGVDQDKQNTDHILQYLHNVNRLHGICILLKPNESRLTPDFMFCLTSLLTNLHKHAVNNIMFCYTNTRATFYSYGETDSLVTEMLSGIKAVHGQEIPYDDKNTFFFDSESFRLLACLQNGMKFKKGTVDLFSESWVNGVEETFRLLSTIAEVKPHLVAETVSLNDARKLITLLSRPLALIVDTITGNIARMKDQRMKIHKTKEEGQLLQACLYKNVETLETAVIPHPRTVCTANSCIHLVNGVIEYSTVCHDPCALKNVTPDTIGHPDLAHCACIGKTTGKCVRCRCSWQAHQHVTYSARRVTSRKKDESVEKQIKDKRSTAEIVQSKLDQLQKDIQELNDEKEKITTASIQFAVFLKENAITPFNDCIDQYLLQMIEERRMMGHTQEMEALEELRARYKAETELYKENLAASTSKSVPLFHSSPLQKLRREDVPTVLAELEKLPISGASLRDQMQASKRCMEQFEGYRRSSTYSKPKLAKNQGFLRERFSRFKEALAIVPQFLWSKLQTP